MKKINWEETFVITCDSFEERYRLYLILMDNGKSIGKSDLKDYKSEFDYMKYPNVAWHKTYEQFAGAKEIPKTFFNHPVMTCSEFLETTNLGLNGSAGNILKFRFTTPIESVGEVVDTDTDIMSF